MTRLSSFVCLSAWFLLTSIPVLAQVPDLTAGGTPGDARFINLGPTGMEGWIYTQSVGSLQETANARQILVTKVDAGSPADGVLAVDDVILGADGTGVDPVAFTYDARRALAHAIDAAEGRNPAELKLLRWRSGLTTPVTITLEYLGGSYSPTAPYNCPKSAAILQKGIDYIMSSEPGSGYGGFGTTVLMAANDPAHPSNAARQARAQAEAHALNLTQAQIDDMTSGDLSRSIGKPWAMGPQLITQAEYYLQTGDNAVLPSIRARAIQLANAQSLFGTMGHHYALPGPNGEVNAPYGIGYGPVNNAGMPPFIGLILARKCGLEDPEIVAGIERAAKYFQYYADLGTVPYGENKETGSISNNGKSGLAAIALGMLEEYQPQSKYFVKLSVFGARERDSGHTGPFFNQLWTPLASNLGGEAAMARYFNQTSWLYDLARRWNGAFVYQPYYQSGGIRVYGQDHRASWTTLLTYATPLAKTFITGKDANPALALDAADMADINHAIDYTVATRTTAELIEDLKSPFPQLHWSAGSEIGNNRVADHASIIPTLIDMANNGATYAEQHGAIFTLNRIAEDSTAPDLAALLFSPNSKVRYMAANALSNLSMAAKTDQAANIVNALIATDRPLLPLDPENPMHADKQAFGQLLFSSGAGIWGGSRVNDADRSLLYPAFRIIATAPMGGTRDIAFSVAPFLTKEDAENLAEALVTVASSPPPGEITYGHRSSAITAMQINGFSEGVPASTIVYNDSTKDKHLPLNALANYGASSLSVKPDPKIIEFCKMLIGNNASVQEAQAILDAIAADQIPAKIRPFKNIDWIFPDHPALTLPQDRAVLRAHAIDHANGDSVFTWRKVHGAGEATFIPNGTGAARNTTVVFDGVPGKYLFEVKMTDSRGLTEVTNTVEVTLNGADGTLPANLPPTANPQSLTVASGAPTPVILTGSDPEGLALTYEVVNPPTHGVLTGTPPYLTYTAAIHYTGADGFSFRVIDSNGQVATAAVDITVDPSAPVGLAIYEPFRYPVGNLNGVSGIHEVGLAGNWATSLMTLQAGSLNYGPLVTNGNSLGSLTTTGNANRAIAPAALAANGMLDDGSTLWFSMMVGHPGSSWTQRMFIALANNPFSTSNNNFSIINNGPELGSGIGITVDNEGVLATQFRDASHGTSTTAHVRGNWSNHQGSVLSGQNRLVVGRITWGADADTLDLFLPYDDLQLPSTPSSSLSVSVDQSAFDTLTFARSGSAHLDEIRFGSTYQSVLQGTVPMGADITPPTPNPMGFVVVPRPAGSSSITMTAATAHDALGVEYYFACTSGGGNDSGWQDSPVYTDTGLTAGVSYSYTVKARDKHPGHNETAASAAFSATIPLLALVPDLKGIPEDGVATMLATADLVAGTVTTATEYSLTIPSGHILSQTPAGGSTVAYGSAVNVVVSIGEDPNLPKLASADIVDDQNGGPVVINTPMTFTVTFSKPMNAAAVSAADFTNVGDAAISVGAVTELSPGVFTVVVTPTSTGLLRFAVAQGAVLTDAEGNALNTSAAIIDDTVIAINLPDETVPNVVGLPQVDAEAAIAAANLTVGSVHHLYSEIVAIGNVISQTPNAGALLPGQFPVDLVISLGTPPDTTPPVIAKLVPAYGSNNVETGDSLVVYFDEDIVRNTGFVTIRNLSDATEFYIPMDDTQQIRISGVVMTIDPTDDLLPGTSYAVRISQGAVRDMSGNGFAGITSNGTWTFTTSLTPQQSTLFTEDFEAPDVAAYSQGTAPPNWVRADQGFNSSLHGLTDKAGGDFTAADPNHQGYAFRGTNTGMTTAEGIIATVEEGATYRVTFDVVKNNASGGTGTAFSARMLAFEPGALRNDCRSNGTGIQLGSVTGNSPSNGSFDTVSFEFTVPPGHSSIGRDLAVRFIGASSSAVIDNVEVRTINPNAPDVMPPVVVEYVPAPNSTAVSLEDNLVLTFNENIVRGSGTIVIKNLTLGTESVINTLDTNRVIITGATLTINLPEVFLVDCFYSVRISNTAVYDPVGNAYVGIHNDTQWKFSTGEITDIDEPLLVSTNPANSAVNVPWSTGLTAVFNEKVLAGSGNIRLRNLTDQTESVISVNDESLVHVSAYTMTITPPGYLAENATYAVRIDEGAIRDLSGNPYIGIADDVTWSFHVSGINPPLLIALDPVNGAVNVPVDGSLTVSFDKPVIAGTGAVTLRNLSTSTDTLIDITDPSLISISGNVLTIHPPQVLADGNYYTVLISAGAITDLSGNAFAGITNEATWNFMTGVSTVGMVFFDDFEVESGSPDVDALGSLGDTSMKTGPQWVRASTGFGSSRHGIVDESSGQFADPTGEQAYAFRYTNSGITTKEAMIGALQAGRTYSVSFYLVQDGHNEGAAYTARLVTFAPGASRTDMASGPSKTLAEVSGSHSGTNYALVTFQYTADEIADAAVLGHDVAVRLVGRTTSSNIDNVMVTATGGEDAIPPTLAPEDIIDDKAGGAVAVDTLVTYTLTFSEAMDATMVVPPVFGNAGTAAMTIGTITRIAPQTFTVQVTPTSEGSLQFQVNAGAVLLDLAGNPLDTSSAIADASVLTVNPLSPLMATVPGVLGFTQANAEAAIIAANLVVGTVTEQNSSSVPAGAVISQNPVGGVSVEQGSAVDLVISLGPVTTTVPNVIGQSQTTAESNILAANLVIGLVNYQYDSTVPVNHVINQSPTGGAPVGENSAVDLLISLGPFSQTHYAASDIVVSGTVTGTVANTQASDNSYQSIQEIETGGRPTDRVSYLEHKWAFEVGPADSLSFHVEAHHATNTESDHFLFSYSTSGPDGPWLDMLTVTKTSDDNQSQSFQMPPSVEGTIHIRVIDTDRTAGNRALDTLYIDQMYLLAENAVLDATAPDVVGLPQAAAEDAITFAGLVLGTVTPEISYTVPAGAVIRQNPAGGTDVVQGSAVDLVVSSGPPVHTVTFEADGGSAADPISKQVTFGSPYGILATSTRDGYILVGWFDSPSFDANEVTAETLVTTDSNHTLYARWAAASYAVTFDANGGTAADPGSIQVTYDELYGPLPTTSRTGYTLNGWFTAAEGGEAVTAESYVTATADHTLYARWTLIPVSVVTDVNTVNIPEGGTETFQVKLDAQPADSVTVTVAHNSGDTDISVQSGGSLTFTTANWDTYQTVTLAAAVDADAENGTATLTLTPSDLAYTAAEVTATEIDKDTTLTVASGGNGSTTPSGAVIVEKGAATAISATPSAGYDFVNWTVTSGAAILADANAATTTATLSEPATVQANFAPVTYVVTYNGNENTSGTVPGEQEKLHDISLTLATNTGNLTKTGFSFVGWNTAADGTGTAYAAGASYTENAPLSLYAQWTPGADGTWLQTAAGPFNWSDPLNWSGGVVASGADRTAFFTPNITANQAVNLDAAFIIGNITFTDSTTSSHNLTISGANVLTLSRSEGVPAIDVTQSGRTLTISSEIAGTDGLQKDGAGILRSTGTNTFLGGIVMGGGRIIAGSDAALGDTSNGITFTGTQSALLLPTGNFTLDSNRTITSQTGAMAVIARENINNNGAIDIGGQLTGQGGFQFSNGYQLGSVIYNLSNASNNFQGTLRIGGDYSGVHQFTPSIVTLNMASLADGIGYGNIQFGRGNNGSANTLTLNYTNAATSDLVLENRRIEMDSAAETAVLSNSSTTYGIIVNTDLLVSRAGNKTLRLSAVSGSDNNVFAGDIADGTNAVIAIEKVSSGTWALGGTHTYSGRTTLAQANPAAGGITFQGMQSVSGNTQLYQHHGGGTGGHGTWKFLDDSATPVSKSMVDLLHVQRNAAQNALSILVGNNSTANGGTSASTQTGSTIQLGNLTFQQEATAATGGARLNLTGANDYGLQIGNLNIELQAAYTGTWNVRLDAISAGLTVGGNVQQAAGSLGTTHLQLDGDVNGNVISGNILDSADVTPQALAVTKEGVSTWTLSGTNTYTGNTTISGGKLFINGDQSAATGNVSVAANATLGGTGTIGGNTTVAANGRLEFNLGTDAAGHDALELAATRTLTFSGASVLTITSSGGASPGIYTLVTAPGGITGSAPATVNLPADWEATTEISGNSLVLNVNSTGSGPGPVVSFAISGVPSQISVGTSINDITLTALDDVGATATSFTGTVTFGGTAGIIGTSASFVDGVLQNVSITPMVIGNDLTFTVDDGSGHTGSRVFYVVSAPYDDWSSASGLAGEDAAPAAILQPDGLTNLEKFAFGMNPTVANFRPLEFVADGELTAPGAPTLGNFAPPGNPDDERAVFTRRKDHAAAGLVYTVHFSADLKQWTASAALPAVITDPNSTSDHEVVSVPFADTVPVEGGGDPRPPQFMRVTVSME